MTETSTTNKVYALNVKFVVKPERREEFLKVIVDDQKQTLATEPGALSFVVGEDETVPNVFYLHEEYKTKADFEHHQTTEHFATFQAFAKDGFQSDPVVDFFTLYGPGATQEQIPITAGFCLNLRLKLNPERRDEFLEAILHNQDGCMKSEPGCLQFQLGECEDAPNEFCLFEQYDGKGGFDAHKESDHFKVYKGYSWSENAFLERPVGQKYSAIVL